MRPDSGAPVAGYLPAAPLLRKKPLFSIPSIVARPSFRRWAARFFLTRPIARKQASALFDLCAGFVYAQILQACLQLDVFTILAKGPLTAEALGARIGLAPPATLRLLEAAIALKLIRRQKTELFALGMLGAALVDNEAIAAMVAHHTMFYADMADPVALLRGDRPTALGRYWAYARAPAPAAADDQAIAPYTALMAASQGMVADEILDAYPVRRHACLMDVGGGDGMFLSEAAKRAPKLQLRLFDLPAVAERATSRFAKAGLMPRTQVFGGSFLHDPLPQGADLISIVRVAHDHDDESVLTLLRAAHDALPRHGALLLAEPMAETPGAERMGHAYFGFYLLAMGSGRPRSAAALTAMLRECGFGRVRAVPTHTPLLASVLIAHPA
jgi:demethylspheroidene O-methyltransferase